MKARLSHRPGGAFTLMELLMVMAIIILVTGLAMPAMNSVLKGSQLTQAGQLVNDQLSLARQTALSRNHSVEVRFYQYGDPQTPGEQASNPAAGKYRALQLFDIQESGAAVAVGKVQTVPASIIVDSGATLSSMIGSAQPSSPPVAATGTTLNTLIPRVGKQYNSVSFRFLPGGSTNLLPQTSSWFLTLHSINDGDALSAPKNNFITIQIDAANGHIKTFRP